MTRSKPSFLRLFLGGFAFGAAALVSVQALTPEQPGWVPAAQAHVAR